MNPDRLTHSRPAAAAMHDTGTPAWLSPATNTPVSCAAIGENTCATNALPSTREISSAARAPDAVVVPGLADRRLTGRLGARVGDAVRAEVEADPGLAVRLGLVDARAGVVAGELDRVRDPGRRRVGAGRAVPVVSVPVVSVPVTPVLVDDAVGGGAAASAPVIVTW